MLGGLEWLVWAFSGALKPTVKGVYCRRRVEAVCPSRAVPVGVRLSARTLRRVGSKCLGLAGGTGFVGLGFFDIEGLFDVVSDGQCQHADGVSGQTKRAAPPWL